MRFEFNPELERAAVPRRQEANFSRHLRTYQGRGIQVVVPRNIEAEIRIRLAQDVRGVVTVQHLVNALIMHAIFEEAVGGERLVLVQVTREHLNSFSRCQYLTELRAGVTPLVAWQNCMSEESRRMALEQALREGGARESHDRNLQLGPFGR